MTGDPDSESGISFLMNYPPLDDIGPLLETMNDLLAKEKKISAEYVPLSTEMMPSNQPQNILDPPRIKCEDHPLTRSHKAAPAPVAYQDDVDGNELRAQLAFDRNTFPRVHRTGRRSPQSSHQMHDVAESIGNIAGELLDFGSKTASAAIATIQKQCEVHWHAIDHPLQNESITAQVNHSRPARRGDDFSIAYRPHSPNHVMNSVFVKSKNVRKDEKLRNTAADVAHFTTVEKEPYVVAVNNTEKINTFKHNGLRDANSVANVESNYRVSNLSNCIDEVPMQKNSKELANVLDKCVSKLMNHFHGCSSIPHEIRDAIADIDLVKKELLQQADIASLNRVRSASEESGSRSSRSGRRQVLTP
ncbi:hypothetical protein ACHAXA_004749 [Cyclostephanos tholiformis]